MGLAAAAIAAIAAVAARVRGHAADAGVVATIAATAAAAVAIGHAADTGIIAVAAADPNEDDRDDDPPSVVRPAIERVTHDCLPPKFDFTSYYGSAHQLVHDFSGNFRLA